MPCQKILCHWLSGLLAPYKNKMKKRFLFPQLNFSLTQINFPLINSIHYTSKHHWHPLLMQLSDLLMIIICIITNHEDFLLSCFFFITIIMISIDSGLVCMLVVAVNHSLWCQHKWYIFFLVTFQLFLPIVHEHIRLP